MQLPLLFTFKQVVLGDGFIAGVRMSGRALLAESDEVWITGVAPVGLAGGGIDRAGAFADFRKGWAEILFDISSDSASFEEFRTKCEEFLGSALKELTEEWEEALEDVRARRYVDPLLTSQSADEQQVAFEVVELKPRKYASDENEAEVGLEAAA
jgi:hypothetical protein